MIDFFEFSNEMFCIADHRGYFTRVNQAWTKTLGWSAAEMTSCPFVDFVHPDDVAATIREASLLSSGSHETILFENRYRCRDGSYRWFAWRATCVPTTQELMATARDVTDQKLQAQELAESEERFRTLANNAPIGIAQSDAEGSIFYANSKWCDLAGVAPADALGYAWKGFIHPDDLPTVLNHWAPYVQAGLDVPAFEFRFLHNNGSIRWASTTVAMLKDASGKVTGQIGTLQDITERKEAEHNLRESDERFRAFMNHSPAVAWAKDEQGRYVYLNKAFEDRFQVRLEEGLELTDFDLWPAEFSQVLRENDLKVLATGESIQITEETLSADQERHSWFNGKFLFRDSRDRRLVGGVGVEVTELKQAEQKLLAEQELLRNLIQVQENEKQSLCREVHDGLIQYAVGALMLVEGYRQNPSAPAGLSKLEEAIQNLRQGVDDGRRTIRGIRPAVLDDLGLEAAMEDLVGQFVNAGMLIQSKCDPSIGRLPDTIQTAVYRVVQEALNNAKKHSGTDVVRIELKKTDGCLDLEVRDFGCGFDVASARKRGFGLQGMVERVRLLGGQCQIESQRDAGACIKLRLAIPAADAES